MQRPGSAVKPQEIKHVFRIYGLFYDPDFYLIEILIRKLHQVEKKLASQYQFEFYKLNQTQYDYYLKQMKQFFIDRSILMHVSPQPLIIMDSTKYIINFLHKFGKIIELFQRPLKPGQLYRPPELIGQLEYQMSEKLTKEEIQKYFIKPSFIYFLIQVNGYQQKVPQQFKVVIQLFHDIAPVSCKKFIELSLAQFNGYSNTSFNRICKNYFIQGGKIDKEKITPANYQVFEDEIKNYIKHDKPGIVGLTNLGFNHSNNFQFYITFNQIPGFDGKTVVIGQVILGMRELKKINKMQPSFTESPIYGLQIIESGIYKYDPTDFEKVKKNQIRISTAPYKERKKDNKIDMLKSAKSLLIGSTQNRLEQGIMESSKFMFELSDSEVDQEELYPVDLVYSQSKPSFFNNLLAKQQSIIKKDDDDELENVIPNLSESFNQKVEPLVSGNDNLIVETTELQELLDSYSVKMSYISGF